MVKFHPRHLVDGERRPSGLPIRTAIMHVFALLARNRPQNQAKHTKEASPVSAIFAFSCGHDSAFEKSVSIRVIRGCFGLVAAAPRWVHPCASVVGPRTLTRTRPRFSTSPHYSITPLLRRSVPFLRASVADAEA